MSGSSALSMEEARAYTDKNFAAFQAARDAFFASRTDNSTNVV